MVPRSTWAFGVLFTTWLVSTNASADDDPPPAPSAVHPAGYGLDLGLFGGLLGRAPGINDFRTPAGFSYTGLDRTTVQPGHAVGLIGIDLGLSFALKTLLWFPLVGIRWAVPVGYGFERQIPASPTPATLNLSSDGWGEILLPGIGLHVETSGALFSVAVQPVVEVFATSGTLTQGVLTTDIGGTGSSVGVDGEVKSCLQGGALVESWKNEPAWLCLYAAPFLLRTVSDEAPVLNGMIVGVSLSATSTKWPF